MNTTRPILTITGSDSTGGSGVQADIKTISLLGGYAVSAITAITVQNTLGIQEICDLSAQLVEGQMEAVVNDVEPHTVKVGMIRSAEVLDVLVRLLRRHRPRHVIYVPVVQSSQGDALMSPRLVADVEQRLLPLCTLVVARRRDAALMHLQGRVQLLDDDTPHGLVNTFASAMAYHLNEGEDHDKAMRLSTAFVTTQRARTAGLRGRGNELYGQFVQMVDSHFRQNSDVAYYADELNVSACYLAQVTRRIGQQTPKAVIDNRLAAEAERLLMATGMTIQEIAYDLGFSTQAHFARFFKKMRGLSPTDYRHKNH